MMFRNKPVLMSVLTLSLAFIGQLAVAQTADKPDTLTLFTTPEWAQYVEPSLTEFTEQHGIDLAPLFRSHS